MSFVPLTRVHIFPSSDFLFFYRSIYLDNSGKIDFKEFLQAINITSQGTPDKKLDMAFRMYDCNGDGSIDETEMRRIISVRMID